MADSNSNQPPTSLLSSQTLRQLIGPDIVHILKCGICLDFFKVPIVLPCGHTFCLHCLTQLCTQASLKQSQGSTKDVRIGCPSCRVLIYATPILRRNVTCNVIIQSLVECLKVRQVYAPNMTTRGVNTDIQEDGDGHTSNHHPPPTSTSSSKQTTPFTDDDAATTSLLGQFDRLTSALGNTKPSIVDMAFVEIEQIRSEHLGREKRRQAHRDAKTRDQVRAVQNIMKKSREEHQKNQQQHQYQLQQRQQQQQQQRQILTRTQHQQQHPHHHQQQQESRPFNFSQSNNHSILDDTDDLLQLQRTTTTKPSPFPSPCTTRLPQKHSYPQQLLHHQPHGLPQQQPLVHPNHLQPHLRFSMHEPPQKCRKLATDAATQFQPTETGANNTVPEDTAHKTNMAEQQTHNLSTSATQFQYGGTGILVGECEIEKSCVSSPLHPKPQTSGHHVVCHQEPH